MDAETALNGSTDITKPKTGRPPGYPKSGGRRKGADSAIGKAGREWLAKNSLCLDNLARVCAGKPLRLAGPTGKKIWHYPTWADQKWAMEQILPRLVPALSSAELSGPDGAPLLPPLPRDQLYSDIEVAQRILFLLDRGDEAKRVIDEMDGGRTAEATTNSIQAPEAEAGAATPGSATTDSEDTKEPTEPLLPRHAYIYLEQGALDRSGDRSWLVFAGEDCLRIFHGPDARQKARSWVGTKFCASPAKEVEISL